jgi:hypothetical protein
MLAVTPAIQIHKSFWCPRRAAFSKRHCLAGGVFFDFYAVYAAAVHG